MAKWAGYLPRMFLTVGNPDCRVLAPRRRDVVAATFTVIRWVSRGMGRVATHPHQRGMPGSRGFSLVFAWRGRPSSHGAESWCPRFESRVSPSKLLLLPVSHIEWEGTA